LKMKAALAAVAAIHTKRMRYLGCSSPTLM
jgi:hypothetical protein